MLDENLRRKPDLTEELYRKVYDPDRTLQRHFGDNVQIGREQFGYIAPQESEQLQSRCYGQTA